MDPLLELLFDRLTARQQIALMFFLRLPPQTQATILLQIYLLRRQKHLLTVDPVNPRVVNAECTVIAA